ncbi:hypothetical protein TNCV_3834231 [Trichonephila clavipes]|nr:hypothetical protein TNCV_3834231 [Trichonephila clavipes]
MSLIAMPLHSTALSEGHLPIFLRSWLDNFYNATGIHSLSFLQENPDLIFFSSRSHHLLSDLHFSSVLCSLVSSLCSLISPGLCLYLSPKKLLLNTRDESATRPSSLIIGRPQKSAHGPRPH